MRKSIVRILKYIIFLVVWSYLTKDKRISYEIVLLILRNNMVLGGKKSNPQKTHFQKVSKLYSIFKL